MPIICLEGPSGVGKSTTAQELMRRVGAVVIPEVNELFQRPNAMPENWYLEKQAERWRGAEEKSERHEWVVLDGDPFQPLWYNWSYGFTEFGQTLESLVQFYRPLLESSAMRFPDRYFLLHATPDELRRRKENDASRTRRNFDKHLAIIEPQKRYFNAMDQQRNGLVEFIEAESVDKSADRILTGTSVKTVDDNLQLFDKMVEWFKK